MSSRNTSRNASLCACVLLASPFALQSPVVAGEPDDSPGQQGATDGESVDAPSPSPLRPLRDFYAIRGVWRVAALDDIPQPEKKYAPIAIDGLRISFGDPQRNGRRYEYVLNTLASPPRMDLHQQTSDSSPQVRATYRLAGDELLIHFPASGGAPPEDVDGPAREGERKFLLRRQSAAKSPSMSADQILDEAVAKISGTGGVVDYPAAASLILMSANSRDPRGELWLAVSMHGGRCGFIEAPELANRIAEGVIEAVESMAERGDPHAQLALAEAYENGVGVEADDDAAEKWNKASWGRGMVHALYNCGRSWGESKASRERYRPARDRGHVGAAVKIATHIRDGEDCNRDVKRAIREYRVLVNSLSPEAMIGLGRALALTHDDALRPEALLWTRRAAEAGSPEAMRHLGVYYLNGWHGLAEDKRLGVQWLFAAAEVGSQYARDRLVSMNVRGAEKYRNDDNYEDPSLTASRARYNQLMQMAGARYSGGRSSRLPTPSADEIEQERYRAYQSRRLKSEAMERLNAVVPGVQEFPYGYGYPGTGYNTR